MLKPRVTLIECINRQLKSNYTKISDYKKSFSDITHNIKIKHNIRGHVIGKYVSLEKSLDDASDFVLYAILEQLNPSLLSTYFSDSELKKYSNLKIEDKKIEFPLKLNAIQVDYDQWIGEISAKQLMHFRETQLIEYNTNTQRATTTLKINGKTTNKITLNHKAVENIKNFYEDRIFIPNTLTFNMPEDTVFDYDSMSKQLVIEQLDHFDILDGYHRYIALSEIYNSNPDFDYQMEIRIVSFEESKAKQFIYQEDQKTKMSKIASDSYNQYKPSNIIVERLRTGALKGLIDGKNKIIDAAYLSDIIDTWIMGKKKLTRSEEISFARDLSNRFKELEEMNPHIYDSKWTKNQTYAIFTCMKYDVYAKEVVEKVSSLKCKNKKETIIQTEKIISNYTKEKGNN